nr:sigma-70 family RNA polymerase sigma factor [Lacticaseibacillus absianus]
MQDYLGLEQETRYFEWKIRKAAAEADRWSNGDLSRLHIHGQGTRAGVAGDEIEALQQKLDACEQEKRQLLELIDTFDETDNQILRYKYIDGLTLEVIAAKLHYSTDTVAKRHAELHRRLDWLDEWEKSKRELEDRLDY